MCPAHDPNLVNTRRSGVSIEDVAVAAGVSSSTVSNALNGRPGVRPATRELVLSTAATLGYRANPTARSLRTGRTDAIGLLLPQLADRGANGGLSFSSRFIRSVTHAAFQRGSALILAPQIELDDVSLLPIDGAIALDPVPDDPALAGFRASGTPVVAVGRDPGPMHDGWWAGSDTRGNTHLLLDHLAALGSVRIALAGSVHGADELEIRDAYLAWCAQHRREPVVWEVAGDPYDSSAIEAMRELLRAPAPADAVMATTEAGATAILDTARATHVRVPDDLRIAAMCDGDRVYRGDPPITALDLHPSEVAEAAVELLVARVKGAPIMRPRIVKATLHVRASTNACAGRGAAPSD